MKRALILLTAVFLITFLSSCYTDKNYTAEDTQIENNFEKGYSTYTDGIFGFSVTFPSIWASETLSYRYASKEQNASPDSGVYIYIDGNKENYIYVYQTHGKQTDKYVVESGYEKTDIDEGLILYTKENGNIMEAQAFLNDNDHISANIKMDLKLYELNKSEILKLLKSIY